MPSNLALLLEKLEKIHAATIDKLQKEEVPYQRAGGKYTFPNGSAEEPGVNIARVILEEQIRYSGLFLTITEEENEQQYVLRVVGGEDN